MAKEKKETAVKKKAVQKPVEDLILKNTIHIAGVQTYNDNKEHVVKGDHYPAGTVVTEAMVEAYEKARIKVGGNTPIESFCH